MLDLNFYKVRTGLDIRPIKQGGDEISQQRYNQIIETITQKAELAYIAANIFEVIEKGPKDLGAYAGKQRTIYVLIFGVDKSRSGWTASDLKTTLGNMRLPARIIQQDSDAEPWVGGLENNINCEAAFWDLRTKKAKNK